MKILNKKVGALVMLSIFAILAFIPTLNADSGSHDYALNSEDGTYEEVVSCTSAGRVEVGDDSGANQMILRTGCYLIIHDVDRGDPGLADSDLSLYSDGGVGIIRADKNTDGDAAGDIVFQADDIGVGTTSPDYKLQVNGVIAPETTTQDLGTSSLRWDLYANAINANGLGAGLDNTVLILDSSYQVTTDEIDSRVWGSTLIDGSGSAGHVTYWSDADTITYDSNQFYWDATNNRLGIGTISPVTTLDINGGVATNVHYENQPTSYSAQNTDFTILINPKTAGSKVYLPDADDVEGQIYIIKNAFCVAQSDPVEIVPNFGQEIDGDSSSLFMPQPGEVIQIQARNGDWYILSHDIP